MAYGPMAKRLAGRFLCFGLDLRAHGESERGLLPLSPLVFAEDLLGAVQDRRWTGCYVIGHSMGAVIALLAEAMKPGTFGAMFLYEPALPISDSQCQGHQRTSRILAVACRKRRTSYPSRKVALQTLSTKPPFSDFELSSLDAFVRFGIKEDPGGGNFQAGCDPEDEAQIYELLAKPPSLDCKSIRCPVTVAQGSNVMHMHAHLAMAAADLSSELPSGCLARLEGLGHFGPLQAGSRVAQVAEQFFLQPNSSANGTRRMSKL
eukprot:evm.model.scf_989.5 EVM.evm.TU.scf_989.5   scf_989:36366-40995(-)